MSGCKMSDQLTDRIIVSVPEKDIRPKNDDGKLKITSTKDLKKIEKYCKDSKYNLKDHNW